MFLLLHFASVECIVTSGQPQSPWSDFTLHPSPLEPDICLWPKLKGHNREDFLLFCLYKCELKLFFEVYVNTGYISDVVAVITLATGLVTPDAANF